MKSFFILILGIVIAVDSMTVQEQRAMLVGIAQDCKATEGASDNDLSLLILKKPMVSKVGKCFFACILEQAGIMEDNKWNEKGFLDFIAVPLNNDEAKIKIAEAIGRKCQAGTTDSDRCEYAHKGTECLKKGLKKEKLDIGI